MTPTTNPGLEEDLDRILRLEDRHAAAAEALANGGSLIDAALAADVSDQVVLAWMRSSFGFQAHGKFLNRVRDERLVNLERFGRALHLEQLVEELMDGSDTAGSELARLKSIDIDRRAFSFPVPTAIDLFEQQVNAKFRDAEFAYKSLSLIESGGGDADQPSRRRIRTQLAQFHRAELDAAEGGRTQ